ncbi:MAG: glycosyltransferase family 39 protein [Phycisphaerae bacterium]|jgi:4-amino-4-deoxy-L-arabinose transferase-like glycosyltransferase
MCDSGQVFTHSFLEDPLEAVSRRVKPWRWGLAGAILVIYLFSISRFWWIGPDSGLYLNLARQLAEGHGYALAGIPHVFVPPGFPLLLAGLMKLGAGAGIMNAVLCLLGLATIFVVYQALRQMVHANWAMILTACCALLNETVQRSGELLSDMPFMLIVWVALWLYLRGLRGQKPDRRGWEIASLLLPASCAFRVAGIPLVVGIAIGLLLSAPKGVRLRAAINAAIVLAGLAVGAAAAISYVHANATPGAATYAQPMANITTGYLSKEKIIELLQHLGFAVGQLSRLLIAQRLPLILCLVVWVTPIIIGMVRSVRTVRILASVAIVCYVGGLCIATAAPRTRYLLPILPLLLMLWCDGLGWILLRIKAFRNREAFDGAILISLAILVLFNLPVVGRMIYERHRRDAFSLQQKGRWKDDIAVAGFLSATPSAGYVYAAQPIAWLANVESPMVAASLQQASPQPEELRKLFTHWRLAYAVIDSREPTPLSQAMEAMLSRYKPVFAAGTLKVYAVHPDGAGSPMPCSATTDSR